ncbi:MAG: RHS repeat-associated core domain-containing protein [Micromonosporaceae bacterium]
MDDQTPTTPYHSAQKTSDLCWRLPNARLVWGGKSTELIIGSDGKWRAADDDGAKVELLKLTDGRTNYDNDKEYWRVTNVDGTQFYFGLNQLPGWTTGKRETQSMWGVPVFANHSGEPCFATTFLASKCIQAWRWNLDYVVDRHGNSMAYFYKKDQGRTGLAGTSTNVITYDRGGWLSHIEYGMRAGSELATATPPAKVEFSVAERCLSSCWTGTPWQSNANTANWPDTPWDLHCGTSATSCPNNISPSFFTLRRYSSVKTSVWSGSGTTYATVDQWDFVHQFPSTGNSTSPVLWLSQITRKGDADGNGTFTSLPPVEFGGIRMQNRADYDPNSGMPDSRKYRVHRVDTETGGQILIDYTDVGSGCQFGSPFPDPAQNAKRCFPQYYKPEGAPAGWSWWHKYVVASVTERDLVGGSPDVVDSYAYSTEGSSTAVLWGHDDGPNTWSSPLVNRSWADWRGYSTVVTTTGAAGGPQTQVKRLYYRGLNGDRTDAGENTRSSYITNSAGDLSNDFKFRAGQLHESTEYATPGGQALKRAVYGIGNYQTGTRTLSPDWAQPSTWTSNVVRTTQERTYTYLTSSGTWRSTQTDKTWHSTYGLITQVDDQGDTATTADNTCTRTWYTHNTTKYLIDFANRKETVGVACGTTATYPTDAVADEQYYYDGAATFGTAPGTGNVTKTEDVVSYSGTTPQWIMTSTSGHDSYGRATSSGDALGRITTTEYTHGANGMVTTIKETNPKDHVTTTTLHPLLQEPVRVVDPNSKTTEASYDDLGRLRKVWLPGRPTTETPNTEYLHTIAVGVPPSIETRVLGPNGNQISSFEIYDGLLRLRQTESTAPDGKRTITDAAYDARGLKAKGSVFYNAASPPTGSLVSFADADVANQHRYTHDGLERQTSDALWSNNSFKWQTTTAYGGDRTTVTPPAGGTTTQTVIDAEDQVIERRLYASSDLAGPYDATKYDYDDAGNLIKVTDPVGNAWEYSYDLLGRHTRDSDPDAGVSTMTYDNAGQLLASTDARGKSLAYAYDALGRKTGVFDTTISGTQLASWTYDTPVKGKLTSSTRYAAGSEYTTAVTGYDDGYRVLGKSVSIPAAETGLAGTYATSYAYKINGAPASVTYPQVAGMAAETVNYGYTDTGHVSTSVGMDAYLSGATYDYDGAVIQQVLGASGQRVTLTNTFDGGSRRLTKSQVYAEGSTAWEEKLTESYAYDPAGNITSINETSAGAVVANQCFQYDHLRRLTESWTTAVGTCQATPTQTVVGGTEPYWHSYGYDKIGSRTSMVRHTEGGDTTDGYVYPAAGSAKPHTVSRIDRSGPAGTDSWSYAYDSAGNTTGRADGAGGTQVLIWDLEGHLSKVTAGTVDTTFVYDADGNRLIRRDSSGNAALFMGEAELRTYANGATSATRYYGANAVRVDGVLSWLGSDHHASGQIALTATGLVATRRRLDPFGSARGEAVLWPGEKSFVNGTADPTGLTHLGAREYDPAIGRFISVDPLFDEADPQAMHGYAYANSNPLAFSDPDGKALIGDSRGEYRAYRKYTYKKRGSTYRRYKSGYRYRDWRAPERNRVADKRATAQRAQEARDARVRAQRAAAKAKLDRAEKVGPPKGSPKPTPSPSTGTDPGSINCNAPGACEINGKPDTSVNCNVKNSCKINGEKDASFTETTGAWAGAGGVVGFFIGCALASLPGCGAGALIGGAVGYVLGAVYWAGRELGKATRSWWD